MKREEIMEKFKLLALEPNASDNIYSEVNISYLIKFYKRAKKDIEESWKFFNITEDNYKTIITPVISKYAKKDPLRITFEEICYVNKITDEDVKQYLYYLEQRIDEIEEIID
jgi:hypothetical protein